MDERDIDDDNDDVIVDPSSKREILTGHTALCLMALLGFVLYTATYSVVYIVKTNGKPVAVLEMWMILTHLISSILSCAMRALMLNIEEASVIANAQSSIFLAIALINTGVGTACMQDNLFCTVYYPAAALPPLAASGSIAWAWVMYVASLGCQNPSSSLSLGISHRDAVTAVSLMALFSPQVLFTITTTCGTKWKTLCGCNTALNISLVITSLFLTHIGHFSISILDMKLVGRILQAVAVAFIWIDIISVGFGNGMYMWSMLVLTFFPVVSLANQLVSNLVPSKGKKTKRPVTGIRFPLMLNQSDVFMDDRQHLL